MAPPASPRRPWMERLRIPHRQVKRGLTHPDRRIVVATWLLLLALLLLLARLVMVVVKDFWLIIIAWVQP
jgi:hypothetical protein